MKKREERRKDQEIQNITKEQENQISLWKEK